MLATLAMICLFLNSILGNKDTEIQFITDFQETEMSKNNIVICYLCWNTDYKVKLLNKLTENAYITSILDPNENIIQNFYPSYKQTFIVDLNCNNSFAILQAANNLLLFSSYNNWLLLMENSNNFNDISAKLATFEMHLNSNIMLAQKLDNDKYIIQEVYKRNDILITKFILSWQKLDKFGNLVHRVIANERQNIHKKVLGVSIVILESDTLNHLDDYRFIHTDSLSKVTYAFVKHLVDYVNASIELFVVDSWGYYNKTTHSYEGMIRDIQINKSEIGGTGLLMTKDRLMAVDYLAMTTPTKIRFVFRRPPLSYEQNIFTLPFTKDLWISSICLVLLVIMFLYSTVRMETKLNNDDSMETKNSFLDMVLLIFAALSQQGVPIEPRSASGKIIMISAFTALMFLYVSYSANIVALLQSSASNINTLQDLLESRIKLGADDIVYNRYFMSIVTEPVRRAIYDTKIAPLGQTPHFIPLAEGVRRMRQEFYAFHMELGRGYKIVADTFYESEKCGLQEIDFLDVADAFVVVRKNSTYKEIFTLGLRKLRESGIQNREIGRIYTNKPKCHTAGGSFVSVGLIDCYPAFLVFGCGAGIAVLFLMLEVALQKTKQGDIICYNLHS